jgi:NAD(P) transhydrogenase
MTPPNASRFDLVVLGSGPAGQKASLAAAKLGRRVALIDRREMIGGVCIHTGTIPSKAIREAVLHLTAFNERSMYGDSYAVKHDITMHDLLFRCQHVVRNEADVTFNQMRRNGVTMFFGTAAFVSPNVVRVSRTDHGVSDSLDIHGDHILIATGTETSRPSHVPFCEGRVIDSNQLLELKELPRSLIVVGGGVIGTEYACMMAAVGVRVTLIETRPRLLEFVDEELVELLQFRLRDMGVRLRLGESVANINLHNGASPQDSCVEVVTKSGKRITGQMLMYCIGRQGATAGLNLDAAGLTADERGRVKVNECYQTSVPHIYAAGDVIGFPALAATSMEQGRLAASHMFRQISEAPQTLFPYGIYTIPEISMVGATEQNLTTQGVPYECGVARYREIARGQLIADPHGMLKLIFHQESRRLLGVHAIGTGATELVHIGQAVMTAGMPIDYFVETVFNYPTLAECYKVAALDGMNRARPPRSIRIADDPDVTTPVPPRTDEAMAA